MEPREGGGMWQWNEHPKGQAGQFFDLNVHLKHANIFILCLSS